jgi:hypothetical protein
MSTCPQYFGNSQAGHHPQLLKVLPDILPLHKVIYSFKRNPDILVSIDFSHLI